eukprot:30294-Pelagococcus_subviridis.AAC.17
MSSAFVSFGVDVTAARRAFASVTGVDALLRNASHACANDSTPAAAMISRGCSSISRVSSHETLGVMRQSTISSVS